eukprot:7016218-Prymnesium_polylepis.1
MRWGAGQLYDKIVGGQMRVWDRGYFGSGHGWAGNTIVFWNAQSLAAAGGTSGFHVQSPASGANYCVGCVSDTAVYDESAPWCCGAGG